MMTNHPKRRRRHHCKTDAAAYRIFYDSSTPLAAPISFYAAVSFCLQCSLFPQNQFQFKFPQKEIIIIGMARQNPIITFSSGMSGS